MTAPTPAEVIAKLGELDPDEIARLLAEAAIVGLPAVSGECPVARYVRQESGQYVVISSKHWANAHYVNFIDAAAMPLPATVAEFVRRFDSERYPHLIEGDEEL
jgi:hypothetical protein